MFNPHWMFMKRLISLMLCLGFAAPVQANETDSNAQAVDYHGFHIDTHRMSDAQRSEVLPSILNQLSIVESVGLPESILAFFRKVPLVIDPALQGQPGMYMGEGTLGVVRIQPVILAQNKPILLHELLHAYHIKVLGIDNPAILAAYHQALEHHDYPESFRSAHFLENAREYFAIMGTVYLFGTIQQPPFNCAVMARTEPEYLDFMAGQFGKHACQ